MSRLRQAAATVAVLAIIAAACSSGGSDNRPGDAAAVAPTAAPEAPAEDALAWPGEEWDRVDAGEAGLDRGALDVMAAAAEAGGSNCLVVTRDGRLVDEWYWNGTDAASEQEAFSATKSISSTLVGIAQDRGLLEIGQPASDFIDEWKGTPSEAVTIRNLVSNDSGRFQDFQTDYIEMAIEAPDKTAFSIGLGQQHEPGTTWVYNNAAIQTLEAVLEEATGMDVGDFAQEALFEPLGMESEISEDGSGNTLTFMGAQTSCRDLAQFGLLFERGGEWDGERVLSREWVEEAVSPSTELNTAYGFLWWLNRPGVVGGAVGGTPRQGKLVPAGPDDMFAALGLYNQVLAVFPSSGVVATRLGSQSGPTGARFGVADVAAGVQAALGEVVAAGEPGTGAADGATGG